jgi:hypothetical protein
MIKKILQKNYILNYIFPVATKKSETLKEI